MRQEWREFDLRWWWRSRAPVEAKILVFLVAPVLVFGGGLYLAWNLPGGDSAGSAPYVPPKVLAVEHVVTVREPGRVASRVVTVERAATLTRTVTKTQSRPVTATTTVTDTRTVTSQPTAVTTTRTITTNQPTTVTTTRTITITQPTTVVVPTTVPITVMTAVTVTVPPGHR
jgi:hypothetical protein